MSVIRGGILIRHEQATGAVNGINVVFTTAFSYIPTTLQVFLNGLEQFNPDDFIELSGNSFQFTNPPIGGIDPDRITVSFQRT